MIKGFGYAGKILRVDLSSGRMTEVPTAVYAEKFIGGRGIAAKIYWDEVPPGISALDPENKIIFITGPLAGFSGLTGSRWQICGKSPATDPEHFYYCNLGGSWGAQLKFAGYDGIITQGKSEKPVYLLIQDGCAELRDASNLWGMSSVATREMLKDELGNAVKVVATGTAGDNMVSMATVFADGDASGCGFGAVMGSKKLKAIAVRGRGSRPTVANPERLHELTKYIRKIVPSGPDYFFKWLQMSRPAEKINKQLCYGCINGCNRGTYKAADRDEGKLFCQAANVYYKPALSYYGENSEVPFKATRLCDKYGLDTRVIASMVEWLSRCRAAGILTDANTGIPLSKIGSLEFIETLLHKMSFREGFGDVLAQGIYQAADAVGNAAKKMITDYTDRKAGQTTYGARLYIITGLFYATEPKQPIAQLHQVSRTVIKWKNWINGLQGACMSYDLVREIARKFWGSELAADFSTYEGKALAAKKIQDREYAIESLILCDKYYPIMDVEHSEDHVGDPTIESKLYSAVTGNEIDEAGLCRVGEKVFNLQRAIFAREGHRGREDDQLADFNFTVPIETDNLNNECLVPGKDGKPISRKGAVLDRGKYEKMLEEYYQLRGWDISRGLQTRTKLEELDLGDIAIELDKRGLTV